MFIPSLTDQELTYDNLNKFVHERNSIQMLQNSCIKSKYLLDFDFKYKPASSKVNGKKNASKTEAGADSDPDSIEDDENSASQSPSQPQAGAGQHIIK